MATGGENPYLPPEIVINILKRLPAKSLLRFRRVCKDWRSLLKSPCFITEHHQFAHKNPLLVFHSFSRDLTYSFSLLRYNNMETTLEVERPTMDSLSHVCQIIGSCNGLLCVTPDYCLGKELLLLNPTTREVRQVPISTIDYGIFGGGFGFSPRDRDYKIVTIHKSKIDNISADEVQVFSLIKGSWKQVEFGVIRNVGLPSKTITVNGAVFWLGVLLEGNNKEDHCRMLVSFDLAMEVFTLIPIPSSTSLAPIHTIVLDVYENKVAMLHQYYAHHGESSFIDLWVLEEGILSGAYGKSWDWTKKYSIGPTLPSLSPRFFWGNEIFCQNCKGGVESWLNLTTDNEFKKFHNCLPSGVVCGRLVENLMSLCDYDK